MSRRRIMTIVASIVICFGSVLPVSACTDFLIKSTDDSVVVGRSMEFGIDMQSRLAICHAGQSIISDTPFKARGVSWKSKYGYIFAQCLGVDMVVDGMNEKGLSFKYLWFPGANCETVSKKQAAFALNLNYLGAYVLGNFSTVAEAKSAIAKLHIFGEYLPELKQVPPVHAAIHDAQGNSIVIEFIDGQTKIYDNLGGVMTNAPSFDWHTTNLRNYIQISADNAQPVKIAGTILEPPGQGGGFLVIPGDWTPPSRFVRTCAMVHFAKPVSNAGDAVSLASHILNAVDIPIGAIREKSGDLDHTDYTQWALIEDLTNQVVYYRSYANLTMRAIDLKKALQDSSKDQSIPMDGGTATVDVTNSFQ